LHWPAAVHTTGFDPMQVPPRHVSVCVQASPSSHAVTSGAVGFEHTPVVGSQVPALLHWPAAVHTTGFDPMQVPPRHVSVCVQASPSLHAVPSGSGVGLEHTPVVGSQVPAVWHWVAGAHTTGVPAHAPLVHTSFVSQGFPSLQDVPSGATGFEHMPVAGLHVPATWHGSIAVHTTGVPPQTPLVHTSLVSQELPSLHAVPSGSGCASVQVPVVGSQVPPVWH
jgi:hypothetical protein